MSGALYENFRVDLLSSAGERFGEDFRYQRDLRAYGIFSLCWILSDLWNRDLRVWFGTERRGLVSEYV